MSDNEIDSYAKWSLWRSLDTDNGGNYAGTKQGLKLIHGGQSLLGM